MLSHKINLLNDAMFKALFRSIEARGVVSEVISNLTGIDKEILMKADYQGGELPKKKITEKGKISDVIIKVDDNNKIIVEMNQNYTNNIFNKNISYAFSVASETILKDKIVKLPVNKVPVVIAGGSFNTQGRETKLTEEGKNMLKALIQKLDDQKAYFVIGHKLQGYEKAIIDISKEFNKKFEIDAIIPKKVTKDLAEMLLQKDLNGVCISTEPEELGIYKSFNYEIFERRKSVVLAFDGNSPVSNLVQEAKNGKGKAKIYINDDVEALQEKAMSLDGYVTKFDIKDKSILNKIELDNPEIVIA